jgi:hypothetical protein
VDGAENNALDLVFTEILGTSFQVMVVKEAGVIDGDDSFVKEVDIEEEEA